MTDAPARPKKKIILALHGAGMHGTVWGGITPHLIDYHLETLTLPGHRPGDAAAPLATIAEMAAYVRNHLKDYAPGSVALLGHSMGALVALEAAEDPAVAVIALVGAAAAMPVSDKLMLAAQQDPAMANDMIATWGLYSGNPQMAAVRTMIKSIQQGTAPTAIAADLKACNDYTDALARAEALQKPALVLVGEEDRMVQIASVQLLADTLNKCEFVLVPSCGHMPMLEKPIDTAYEIKGFFGDFDFR